MVAPGNRSRLCHHSPSSITLLSVAGSPARAARGGHDSPSSLPWGEETSLHQLSCPPGPRDSCDTLAVLPLCELHLKEKAQSEALLHWNWSTWTPAQGKDPQPAGVPQGGLLGALSMRAGAQALDSAPGGALTLGKSFSVLVYGER